MRVLIAVLGFAGAAAGALGAQVDPFLGAGVGTVRYAGGSNQNSVSFTPGVDAAGRTWSSSVSGTLASLPGAEWYSQARGSFWGAWPVAGHVRIGGDADAIGTWIVPDSLGNNSAEGRVTVEGLWSRARWGIGVGGGIGVGWIEGIDSGTVTSGRARVRAWWDPIPALDLTGTVEPTHFLGAWYSDVTISVTGRRGPVTLTLWTSARVSEAYGSKGAVSADAEVRLLPILTLAVGGGEYLSDPYQAFPGGTFFSAGLRLHTPKSVRPTAEPFGASVSSLIASRRGDTLLLRFTMPHAARVAIAGDWSEWKATPLTAVAPGIWEAALRLPPGTYHFNLLVDDTNWVVPEGVATVPDGMGGKVAVLTVF